MTSNCTFRRHNDDVKMYISQFDEAETDAEEEPNTIAREEQQQVENQIPAYRRSQRNRAPPAYLQDYATS